MKEQNEVWVPICGYEEVYKISSFGNIKRVSKYGKNIDTLLSPYMNEKGYLKVGLSVNGKRKIFKVHRLVAYHFIENKEFLQEVNHKNSIKTDNNVHNLEWCTRKQNMIHASVNNLIKKRIGKDNKGSRPVIQYSLSGEFIKKWDCLEEAKKGIGVKSAHIGCVCKGKRKQAGGFKWEYGHTNQTSFIL